MFHLVTFLTGQKLLSSYVNALAIISSSIVRKMYPDSTLDDVLTVYVVLSMMIYSCIDIPYQALHKRLKISDTIHHLLSAYMCYVLLQQPHRILSLGADAITIVEVSTVYMNLYYQTKSAVKELYVPSWYSQKLAFWMFGGHFVMMRLFVLNYVVYQYEIQYGDLPLPQIPLGMIMLHTLHVYWILKMLKVSSSN